MYFLENYKRTKHTAHTCTLFYTGCIISNKDTLLECNHCRTYRRATFYFRLLNPPYPKFPTNMGVGGFNALESGTPEAPPMYRRLSVSLRDGSSNSLGRARVPQAL